jgi:DNA topoisomerase I
VKSSATIPSRVDKAMDKEVSSNGNLGAGISIRMGPVEEMDIDAPQVNGHINGKRKSRGSIGAKKTYREDSSDDDTPLVREFPLLPYLSSDPISE